MIVCAEDASLTQLVARIEARVAEKVGSQRYNTWFKNATRFVLTGNHVRVDSPNPFVGGWIERNFSGAISDAVREVAGGELILNFAIDPDLAKKLAKKQPDRQVDFVENNPQRLARRARGVDRRSYSASVLRGRLEDFVVGSSNRLAFTAVSAVVEKAISAYNPLFIHGGCGLGKTHLLQGICNSVPKHRPEVRWRYVSGEEFTNEYVCSVKAREENVFRDRYRDLDLLVIDDVHFFANKRATQEEFLHTFKAIDAAGKQLVLASDAPPKMIGNFSESLVSRFVSGMVVRIDSPDLDVRLNVLRQRAQRLDVEISDPVLMCIAENFRANIRELEGALLKVVALAQVAQKPITLSLAERAIKDLVRQTAPVVMLSDIESIVAIYFGLTPADLHTSRKSRTIALARGIAMYLARKHTDMSFPEIGRFMGNKNHSTVILAARRVSKMLQADDSARWLTAAGPKECNLASLVAEIEEQFGGRNGHAAGTKRSIME